MVNGHQWVKVSIIKNYTSINRNKSHISKIVTYFLIISHLLHLFAPPTYILKLLF